MSAPQFLPWQQDRPQLAGQPRALRPRVAGARPGRHRQAGLRRGRRRQPALRDATRRPGLRPLRGLRLVRQWQPSRPAPHSSRSHRGGRGRRGRRTGRGRRARGRQRIQARAVQGNPHRPDPRVGILVQHRHPPGRLARGATVSGPCAERGLGQRAAQGAGRAAAHTVFLLVADAPDRLLPTLVSRCRRLPAGARCRHRAAMAARAERRTRPRMAGGRRRRAAGGPALGAERRGRLSPWLGQLVAPLAQGQSPDVGTLAEALERCRRPTGSTRCNASIPT